MPGRIGLAGLVEFESVARHGSIALAAEELRRSPAAVSQQVKQLEARLGLALVDRRARSIAITGQGRALAATVACLLDTLRQQVHALRQDDPETTLRLTATHSHAIKWLIPRLHRFTGRHPAFDIRVEASDQVLDLQDGRVDAALRYALARDDDPALLYREQLVVVYSPQLPLAAGPAMEALLRHPLLHEGSPQGWQALLAATGHTAAHRDFSRSYSHGGLLVQAAVAAQGVALVPYSLACEDLAQQRLLLAPCAPVPSAYGYRLLLAQPQARKSLLLSEWLQAEARDTLRSCDVLHRKAPDPAKSTAA
ncbi:MAG: LysR substrate-binding domain-containing protein [Pseudomonadota bacterium]